MNDFAAPGQPPTFIGVGEGSAARRIAVRARAGGAPGNPELVDAVRTGLDDASPLVRGAAVWALSQLLPRDEFDRRAGKAMGAEMDENVRAEWRLAS